MTRLPPWARDVVMLGTEAPLPVDTPFTSAQADAWGVGPRVRRALAEQHLVRPVLRGVWVASHVPESLTLRVAALKLVVPDHAVVVDRTAAWLHRVDALPRSAIHELPRLDVYSEAGHRIRRGTIASGARDLTPRDVGAIDGLRVTTPLRTACDLGRRLWRYDAIGVLDGFLRRGVTQEQLLDEVGRFKGHRGVVQLRHLVPLADRRAESMPESALRLHWHEYDLPWPDAQIWVYDDEGRPCYRIDLGLEAARYGAEYFGEEFHSSSDHEHDEARLAWLREKRQWVIDVFDRQDVYGTGLGAGERLRQGLQRAREAMSASAACHIDLAHRS